MQFNIKSAKYAIQYQISKFNISVRCKNKDVLIGIFGFLSLLELSF